MRLQKRQLENKKLNYNDVLVNDSKLCRLQCPKTILSVKREKIFKIFIFLGEPLF